MKKDIIERLKEFEGSMAYQKKLGYFKKNKFFIYQDSVGKDTIGYGHLVLKNEYSRFKDGISEEEATAMLLKDWENAKRDYAGLGLKLPPAYEEYVQQMVFQMGISRVKGFAKMISYFRMGDYIRAIKESKDSKWYKQCPNRVEAMIKNLG